MIKQLAILLIGTTMLVSAVTAQVISKPEARTNLLDSMDRSLTNIQQQEKNFEDVTSPFIAVMPEKAPVIVEKVQETIKPVAAEVLPDKEALTIISQQFKPLGSLIMGNRGVLQLRDNSTIERGAIFKAEIKGNIYEVEIFDVTSRGYTLKLGTATTTKNFLTSSGTVQ